MNDVLNRATFQYSRLTAGEQIDLASYVITTGRLGAINGTYVTKLEQKVADRIGRSQAIGVASATAGLQIALRALGACPGKHVIIPALGWVSVGTAATATGAEVTIAPITQDLALDWEGIKPLLHTETCAVVLAHMRGMPAPDTVRMAAELGKRGIPLIEDCAQAWGVTVADRPPGRTAQRLCCPPRHTSSSPPEKAAWSSPTTLSSQRPCARSPEIHAHPLRPRSGAAMRA
jgi:dTDP-4-amino-4,6-dideoxygalactose transaminase